MAFDATTIAKQESVQRGITLLHQLRQIYAIGLNIHQLLVDYQAGTDAPLVAAINALYIPAERQELAAMIGQLDTLINSWTATHAAAVAPPIN